ncbi:MAG: glycosyltransferase [Flavobacteriales bacterium]|nr:glycosyltransferase [Flavobacteriales bacterium]
MTPIMDQHRAAAELGGDDQVPDFSIITASYNMCAYLPRCAASVRDQRGVSVEHLVLDGASTDGTVEWLTEHGTVFDPRQGPQRSGLSFDSRPDKGMYDALNRGFSLARGRYVAWLNCDEQYLEGTLAFVAAYFDTHPEVDILFGSALLLDPDGGLISDRRSYPLRKCYLATSHLYNLSCATFFRGYVWRTGLRFDPAFKSLGDHDLFLRALDKGYRTGHTQRSLAAFTFTGKNLSWGEGARTEAARLAAQAPFWMRFLRLPLNAVRLLEKSWHGGYCRRTVRYAVHMPGAAGRTAVEVTRAPIDWPEDTYA